ncbi:Rab3 GTPase-activating protein regulatory subunit N-terminus-domain-containing protein [Gongronella butleri]|nr:Rab3 GTPase-activating protein regulatory subunit N-terminus-domain-containing protein [Gongronella butleri]
MAFHAKLEPHYYIPAPVLSILVGKLPKSTTPRAERKKVADDPWEKDWSWGLDTGSGDASELGTSPGLQADSDGKDTVPSPAGSMHRSVDSSSSSVSSLHKSRRDASPSSSPPPPIVKESYMVSASAAGRTIVLAYRTKFVVVQLHADEGEYIVVGQGSGCVHDKETITAVLCLPLFVPSIRKNQIFVMVGYSSGWLRVFSSGGTLLTAQLLEAAPLTSIKLRTPPPPSSTISNKKQGVQPKPGITLAATHYEDEDITLLFKNGRIVSIDGQSLWMVLRVCDGQRESGIDTSKMHTAFTYKKWQLDQEQISDVISLGPSVLNTNRVIQEIAGAWWTALAGSPSDMDPALANAMDAIFSSTSDGTGGMGDNNASSFSRGPATATARFIAVGADPMISFYATNETSRPLMSAVSMASYMVSRVASPVFSLAKSWWSGQSDELASSPPSNVDSFTPEMHAPPSQTIEPATSIPALLQLSDSSRAIQSIVAAPPCQNSQHHTLAVTSDALGRVILWDIQRAQMLRMWKGVRDARCGWIQYQLATKEKKNGAHRRSFLFLVMYSARRGLLKIFQARRGPRHQHQVGVFHVGTGCRLVTCEREPLGSSMVSADRRKMAAQQDGECGVLSSCLLIAPDGQVRKIVVYPAEANLTME